MPVAQGSRRRRLWDLDAHAHCPVVGLCLGVAALRRIMQRHTEAVPADDYEMHCQAVALTRRRNTVSQALQRDLDTRHGLLLKATSSIKCTDSLGAWWDDHRHSPAMAGALWAVLTHARCTPELETRVLGHVHMQQHEVSLMARALADRQQSLLAEQARMCREHRAMAARLEEAGRSFAQERERLQAEAVRLRGVVLAREARAAQLADELDALRRAHPDLPARQAMAEKLAAQADRLRELQRELDRANTENARLYAEAAAVSESTPRKEPDALRPPEPPAAPLRERAVLCVGGRSGAVPAYRQLVESTGARFLHHDGGTEDGPQRLEKTLTSADLVICQTGCICHDAYWRVKEHCRRTGKRCVFVEQPSASSLQRALEAIGPSTVQGAA
ncbi:MAG: DUF2325 domain-containing protein [Ideonella sp.]|nr:DUF2325 domain-containing protein [Ideonella sp.]